MDYNLKASSLNIAELERQNEPNFAPLIGSDSTIGKHKAEGNCLVNLELGRFSESGNSSEDRWKDPRMSVVESSSQSGSSKRARAPANGSQLVSCLVDGCTNDLSKCRDYHRRHKVCEVHSKTPTVTIGGLEKRFCQQCSRFHSLGEFDEGKRSCRKRLDGHNRRRRKPQLDSLSMNSPRFLSTQQGSRFLPLNGEQMLQTSPAMVTSAWAGAIKANTDSLLYGSHSNSFPRSFSISYKGEKQFPFFRGTDLTLPEAAIRQPLPEQKIFSDGFNRLVESNCALSLLSSPTPAGTREIGLSRMVQPESSPLAQSMIPGHHYNGPQGMEGAAVGSVLGSTLHCQGLFQSGLDGPSVTEPPQTIPFSWD